MEINKRLSLEEYTREIVRKINKRNIEKYIDLKYKNSKVIEIRFSKSDLKRLVRKAMRFDKFYTSVKGDYKTISFNSDYINSNKGKATIFLGLNFSKEIPEFSFKYKKLN